MAQLISTETFSAVPEISKINNLFEAQSAIELLDLVAESGSDGPFTQLLSSEMQPDGSRVLKIGLPVTRREKNVSMAIVTTNPDSIIYEGFSWTNGETIPKSDDEQNIYSVTLSPKLSKLITETVIHNRKEKAENGIIPSHVRLVIQSAIFTENIHLTATAAENDAPIDLEMEPENKTDSLHQLCDSLTQRMVVVNHGLVDSRSFPDYNKWLLRQAEILQGLVDEIATINAALYFAGDSGSINLKIVHEAQKLINTMLEKVSIRKESSGIIFDTIETK